MNFEKLRTVKQIAESNPAFTEASLRWLIYRADENGIDQVLVRVGRRVLFDMEKFNDWLESKRQTHVAADPGTYGSFEQPHRSYVDR